MDIIGRNLVAVIVPLLSGVAFSEDAAKPLPVTRADLAQAYLRLEAALRDHPPAAADIPEINRAFDSLTNDFFTLRFAAAVEKLHRLTERVVPGSNRSELDRIQMSLKCRVNPRAIAIGRSADVAVQLASIYPVAAAAGKAIPATISAVASGAAEVARWSGELKFDSAGKLRLDVGLSIEGRSTAGSCTVTLKLAESAPIAIGICYLVAGPIEAVRKENEDRLSNIAESARQALRPAIRVCQARNRLLASQPSDNNSAEFLADPIRLADEVAHEISELAADRNPYAGKTGDYWRTVEVGSTSIPSRLYVPESLKNAKTPAPLVVALHGAGGDENMFMDAYGAGTIKSLADTRRLMVLSPQTSFFTFAPGLLEGVVEALAAEYSIDRKRVYVLGHSMGAGAAASIARRCAKTVAACCCLAGGGNFAAAGPMSPTLVVAAELDPLIPFNRLESSARKAMEAGRPIEFIAAPGYGHTLMVAAALPNAFDWLLRRQLH